jgi:hypothetical protein
MGSLGYEDISAWIMTSFIRIELENKCERI